jgi:hypothetical protein
VVFTLPAELGSLARANPAAVYDLLMRSAAARQPPRTEAFPKLAPDPLRLCLLRKMLASHVAVSLKCIWESLRKIECP